VTSGLLLLFALYGDAPLATPSVHAARLERAASLLQPLGREGTLGPWRLLTDVTDRPLLAHLERVAARLPEAYRARFGLDAEPRRAEALVLFAREATYRAFTSDTAERVTQAARGHAGGGLAAALAGPTIEETRPVVVHELAHLLTQEAFARAAPPWIDEGLSEDLAWCRADAEGRLLAGSLDATTAERRTGDRAERVMSGPLATVKDFREKARAGRGLPLSALLQPSTRLFADALTRRDAYTEAGLLVRFLLGGDPALADRFRVFLRAATLGAPAGLDDLASALGADAKSLEKEYWTFVRRQ
jgi:hypothetical protein